MGVASLWLKPGATCPDNGDPKVSVPFLMTLQ